MIAFSISFRQGLNPSFMLMMSSLPPVSVSFLCYLFHSLITPPWLSSSNAITLCLPLSHYLFASHPRRFPFSKIYTTRIPPPHTSLKSLPSPRSTLLAPLHHIITPLRSLITIILSLVILLLPFLLWFFTPFVFSLCVSVSCGIENMVSFPLFSITFLVSFQLCP